MSENINTLPNRFENYVIEKPSEYRVLNNNAICVDIDKYTIYFKYEPEETTYPYNFEYVRNINLRIKNEKKLFKRSKKIVKQFLRTQDCKCNIH